MDTGNYDENLLRMNRETNLVEPRRKNFGKEITDNLPTIEVDGTAMDLYSNVSPLDRGPEMMNSFLDFLAGLEYRKMSKRNKLTLYMWGDDENWGMMRQFLEMMGGQHPIDQEVSPNRERDLSALKSSVKKYDTCMAAYKKDGSIPV